MGTHTISATIHVYDTPTDQDLDTTNNTATLQRSFTATITAGLSAATVIPSTTLVVGTAATAFTPVVGSGGAGGFIYSVAPALPTGLSMAPATGTISGTPVAVLAPTSFDVTVEDASGSSVSSSFSLAVAGAATSVSLTTSSPTGFIGQAIRLTASVTPASAVGTITFQNGGRVLCADVSLAAGAAVCDTSFHAAGAHAVTALYSGSAILAPSTSAAITIAITDQVARTVETIAGFMHRRNNLLATHEAGRNRHIHRLNAAGSAAGGGDSAGFTPSGGIGAPMNLGAGGGGVPSAGGPSGRRASRLPFGMSGTTDGPMRLGFATSLSQLRREAAGNDQRRMGDAELGYASSIPAPFAPLDVWVEGSYASFRDKARGGDVDGHFGIVTVGADYVLNRAALVGIHLQFDSMHERDDAKGSEIEGYGWMAGPYAAVRLSEHLFWHARAAWGRSDNEVTPYRTYVDTFDTTRWLVSSSISGRWNQGPWQVSPAASLIYLEETSERYADTFGVTIPEIRSRLGLATAGPEVSYQFVGPAGIVLEPNVTVQVVWNFADDLDATGFVGLADAIAGPEGVRGRVETGLRALAPGGVRLDLIAAFDGVGAGGYSAVSGRAALAVPLN